MVSPVTMDSVSGNNEKVNIKRRRSKQISSPAKFIKSFKITAQLNSDASNSARKIDVITLPVETVSITDEKPKIPKTVSVSKEAVPKKLSWNMRQVYSTKIFEKFIKITSSDSIFTNASLDSDAGTFTITSSPNRKYSLCRSSSIDSLNTIDSQKTWTSSKNAEFTATKCHPTKRSAESLEDFECQTEERTALIRSDSSGYHSEHKLSDSPISSNVSSPKRRISEDYYHDITVTVRSNPDGNSGQAHNQSDVRQATVVKKRMQEFKTPKLPLYRRPPTRVENCSGVDGNVRMSDIVKSIPPRISAPRREVVVDDVDAISLFAE